MREEFVIGLDLGGTDLKAARVTREGEVESFSRRPSRSRESREAPFEAIAEALAELGAESGEARAVGLGCPGPIDPATGSRRGATPHLPHWTDLPLRSELERRHSLRFVVDNDANLAALAEHRLGAARGSSISITVTLGTGIGCGIVVDGLVLHGTGGGAGELGHVPLGRGEGNCACGVPHCVEPEASRARLLVGEERSMDAAEVLERARSGDLEARARLLAMCDRLGATIATAIQILDPDVVVIGGGLGRAGETLLDPLREAVRLYALPTHRGRERVVPAALGERAGVIGAGLAAWDRVTASRDPTAPA